VLEAGGTVIHATETCYGLACDLTNPEALLRLFTIKQRSFDQPVSALFPSIEVAKKYVKWNDRAEKLAQEFLPGRLMIILPARKDMPYALCVTPPDKSATKTQEPRTIGIRVSSNRIASELVTCFGKPISTTSANLHGKPSPYSMEEILEQYKNAAEKPDLILDAGPLPFRKPSRIIDCTGTSDILRRS
jgi:L-threonylcarbamoyladenylate synthase